MLNKLHILWLICVLSLFGSGISVAKPIGGDPPPRPCCTGCSQATSDTPSGSGPCSGVGGCGGGGCGHSVSMGKAGDSYPIFNASASNGVGLDVALTYNSYNADGEKASLNTVMGFGWSHSYNIFLFQQGRDFFKQSPTGSTTKYKRSGRRGPLTATRSHQQTVTENPDGSIDIANNDQLTLRFKRVAGNPIRVAGRAPWMLVGITDRQGNQTTLNYAGGLLHTVEDTYGRQVTFVYDSDNRLVSITDPVGRTTALGYDAANNLNSITDPLGQETRYQYNSRHQIVKRTDRNGRSWEYLYNGSARPVGIRDADGDLLLRMTNSSNWATDSTDLYRNKQRSYVPSTTTLTDGRGNEWRYEYDRDGFVTRMTAPDGAATVYTYDPATRSVASETDANGNTTSYEYDSRNNLIKETDPLGNVTRYEYEPVFNQMTKMTRHQGATTVHSITEYEYDANGNRTKETRDVGGLNLVREWTYDANGNVLTEKDANGHVTSNEYDVYGNLIKVTDAEGNETVYHYDKATVPGYEILGLRTRMVDANGHESHFGYDDLDRLISETDPLGFVTGYQYDGVGNRIEMQRQVTQSPDTFQVTRFEYDSRDRLVREIRDPGALDLVTEHSYDANDNRISTTDPRSKVATFAYDVQNRITLVTDALGNTTETRYDGVGNRLCSIDANLHFTSYEYDPLNRLIRENRKIGTQDCTGGDADDIITQHFYDSGATLPCRPTGGTPNCAGPTPGSSNIAYSIDPKNKYSYFKYDKLDRRWITIRKVVDTADACNGDDWCEYTEYDPADNVLARTDANRIATAFSYFDNDWLETETVDPSGLNETTSYTYDKVGNVLTVTEPNGNITTNSYNDRNELTLVADLVDGPGSKVASYTYDGIGNRKTEQDGNDNAITYGYDDVNRLVSVTDALGEITTHGYDEAGNLTQTTDREGRRVCYRYDDINRRSHSVQKLGDTDCNVIDSDDLWTLSEYDDVGNVTRLIAAKDQAGSTPATCAVISPPADCEITAYQYDEIDRLTLETYPDGDSRAFTYDKASNLATRTDQKGQLTQYGYNDLYYLVLRDYPADADDSFGYDTGGRMTTASKGGWAVSYVYDNANRLLQSFQNGQPVGYAYNIPARIRTLSYPGGRTVVEQMDLRSRLDTVNDGGSPTPIADYAYDLGNRVSTRSYRNGVVATYSYNDNNWITNLDHSNGGGQIAGFGYLYDKEGNKQYEERQHQTNRSEAYAYDDAYRLQDYKVGTLVGSTVPVPTTQTQYDLDRVGNWDAKTTDGVPEVRDHNTVNEITAIDGVPIDHDDNGNLIEDEDYEYLYDQENRLVAVTREADAQLVGQYQYDALGRRVVKIASPAATSVETRFYYDDARVIEEQDDLAATQATYVYGNYIDEILTMTRDGQDYYYHQNALWSVAVVTDSAAVVVEQYAYDAYGLVTVTDGVGAPVPLNAWGMPHSAVGNPYLFTGRRLDEEAGLYYYRARYYDAGKGRFLQRDKLTNEKYEYVGSTPTNLVDPSGLVDCPTDTRGGHKWVLVDKGVEIPDSKFSETTIETGVYDPTVFGGKAWKYESYFSTQYKIRRAKIGEIGRGSCGQAISFSTYIEKGQQHTLEIGGSAGRSLWTVTGSYSFTWGTTRGTQISVGPYQEKDYEFVGIAVELWATSYAIYKKYDYWYLLPERHPWWKPVRTAFRVIGKPLVQAPGIMVCKRCCKPQTKGS